MMWPLGCGQPSPGLPETTSWILWPGLTEVCVPAPCEAKNVPPGAATLPKGVSEAPQAIALLSRTGKQGYG